MLHQISWFTYLIAFALVAGVYYAVLLPLFFRKQIRNFFSRQNRFQSAEPPREDAQAGMLDYVTYEKLRDEVTAYLEGEERDTFKSDILFSLVTIIKRQPALRDERFRGALGKEIRRIYNAKYNDSLSEEELTAIWQA